MRRWTAALLPAALTMMVRQDVPEIDVVAGKAGATEAPTTDAPAKEPAAEPARVPAKKEKSGCAAGGEAASWLGVLILGLALQLRRRQPNRPTE